MLFIRSLATIFCSLWLAFSTVHRVAASEDSAAKAQPAFETLSLDDCIAIALKNHQSLKVSDANIEMAEALYKQAMSAYWPNISMDMSAQRADQDRTISINSSIDGKLVTDALVQGNPVLAPFFQQSTAKPFQIPIQFKAKLFNRDLATAAVNLTYPIFSGGKIPALVGQADKGVKIAEQLSRKTNLEVINDVKKYFYGAQFAKQMQALTQENKDEFEVIAELSERIFKGGSLKLKKTDYLRAKAISAMVSAMLHEATYTADMAHEALGNAMGIAWQKNTRLAEADTGSAMTAGFEALVAAAQQFNPDLQQLNLAIQAADDAIAEAKSGYYPMIGFQASAMMYLNGYSQGLINADNREGWTLGVGLRWNLFDGLQTTGKVHQAQAQQKKFSSQKILLDKGVALLIKQQFLRLHSADAQVADTTAAYQFAKENRQLTEQSLMVEQVAPTEAIQAQILETFAHAALYRCRYTRALAGAELEYLVGSNIKELNQ